MSDEVKSIFISEEKYITTVCFGDEELGDSESTALRLASKYMPNSEGFSDSYFDYGDSSSTLLKQYAIQNGALTLDKRIQQLPVQIALPKSLPVCYIAFSDGVRYSGVYKFAGFEINAEFLRTFINEALSDNNFSDDEIYGECSFLVYFNNEFKFYDKHLAGMDISMSASWSETLKAIMLMPIKHECMAFLGE